MGEDVVMLLTKGLKTKTLIDDYLCRPHDRMYDTVDGPATMLFAGLNVVDFYTRFHRDNLAYHMKKKDSVEGVDYWRFAPNHPEYETLCLVRGFCLHYLVIRTRLRYQDVRLDVLLNPPATMLHLEVEQKREAFGLFACALLLAYRTDDFRYPHESWWDAYMRLIHILPEMDARQLLLRNYCNFYE